MRISDWSSDVCSSDLQLSFDGQNEIGGAAHETVAREGRRRQGQAERRHDGDVQNREDQPAGRVSTDDRAGPRSEEHTSELQSLMRISYAVFCLKKKKNSQPKYQIDYYYIPPSTAQ